MRPVSLRHLLAIAIAITCTILAISNHDAEVSRQDAQNGVVEWGPAPSPPTEAFAEEVLVTPGLLVAAPLMIVAAVFESHGHFNLHLSSGQPSFGIVSGGG